MIFSFLCMCVTQCCTIGEHLLTLRASFFAGHSKTVNCVSWSHSKQCFLSSSEDTSLCIWTASVAEPVLTMVTYQQLSQI